MQGRNSNIIKFVNALKVFMSKLENCESKVGRKYVVMLEKLVSIVDVFGEDNVLPQCA